MWCGGAKSNRPPGAIRRPIRIPARAHVSSSGAGIGLSLVKRICDRYGWQVKLESGEQKGTTVTVVFVR